MPSTSIGGPRDRRDTQLQDSTHLDYKLLVGNFPRMLVSQEFSGSQHHPSSCGKLSAVRPVQLQGLPWTAESPQSSSTNNLAPNMPPHSSDLKLHTSSVDPGIDPCFTLPGDKRASLRCRSIETPRSFQNYQSLQQCGDEPAKPIMVGQ
jgi:hypothetical protein